MLVQKYGGSSVASSERIRNVAERIKGRVDSGEKVIVVVSAMGKTTNDLISLAENLSEEPDPRELAMLLSTGEQMSAALLSMVLIRMGVKSISHNALQLDITTVGDFGNARIADLNLDKIYSELEDHDVIVVTGFQGVDTEGNLTTLGRGGSDTSAVAIAAKAGVPCEIFSDVAGVYTCDPKLHKDARKLEYITYDEMLEMAALGAKVLHSRSVEIAKKYNVEILCLSSFSEEGGTRVVNRLPEWLEQPVVTGATIDTNQLKIAINKLPGNTEIISKIFQAVAGSSFNVDMISIVNDNGYIHLAFTVISASPAAIKRTIENVLVDVDNWELAIDEDVAKISTVGVGMRSSSGVAARFFLALGKAGVKIIATTTSEIKISVLVPKSQASTALKALLDEFEL
ncbi:MAG: aspartate kinase [Thermotogaceae bacterium]|uniref:aspartate kinase n=1 Tax=Mesotoga sp. TaxID=2053577 RepID=UPI0016AC4C4A|nr:aspartate kinase [Mesotoga sp.]MDD3682171.1 aspartate kinase [Mesotoga sp.]NLT44193.1 aspartate kinase [Thermotogaceae bacterium]